ncbi:phage portal protein [Aeoliella sp.]|uniref:phage portal protein n=1 Tax=Aeoliella sp. TaxID=2795800 RepID=UPI003CCC4169
MVSSLENAFASVDRSYLAAKASASNRPEAVLAGDMGGMSSQASSISRAAEQLSRNVGHQYTAAKAIANRIAAQNLYVGRVSTSRVGRKLVLPQHLKNIGENIEPLASHPLLSAFDEPNLIHTRWALLHVSVVSLTLTGVCYWWVTPGSTGLDLWYIPPTWIEPHDKYQSAWKLKPPGDPGGRDVPREDIFVCTLPSPLDPFAHSSPLQAQAYAVETDLSIQKAQYESFEQGIFPKVGIRVGQPNNDPVLGTQAKPVLTPEQVAELKLMFTKLYSGRHNRNSPVILDGMIEGIEKLSLSASEMEYLKSSDLVKSRILQSMGVSPFIVGDTQDGNRAQATVAEQSFCQNTVNPLIECLSQSLTRYIGMRFASPGEKLVAWLEPCSANDRELTLEEYRTARANGDITPNEYRNHILNLPPIDGGDVRLDNLGNPIGERQPKLNGQRFAMQ